MEKKRTRRCISGIKSALTTLNTLGDHTDEELKEVIEGCETILQAAKQTRSNNVDKNIQEMEAKLAELRKLKEEQF